MASPLQLPMEDKDLDDAALWAVIDSAAAASTYTYTSTTAISNKSRKPLTLKHSNFQSPFQSPPPVHHKFSPPLHQPQPKLAKTPRFSHGDDGNADIPRENGVVCEEESDLHRPKKMSRSCVSKVFESSPMAVVRHANHRLQVTPVTPVTPVYSSPETERFTVKEVSPFSELTIPRVEGIGGEEKENMRHCLSGRFPTVSLFKEYQNAAMSILEKSDCTMISGNPFIKKSGWRKIAFYFNISFEIKDKNIEFDESHNVQRAEFVVRAYMQGGRFSDGWGSCERREKKFSKPNHDIPSTAETRAKNKACQDLLGIGLYHAGASASHGHTPR